MGISSCRKGKNSKSGDSMKDSELIPLFTGILENALVSEGVTDCPVAQLFQPTQQPRNEEGKGVYFQILFTRRHGSPQRTEVFDPVKDLFIHTEQQQVVSTIQISVFYPADPTSDFLLTSHDLASQLCMRMQTDGCIRTLRAAGAGVTRITEVRNPNFDNEQDQSEFVPNFDLQINYNRVVVEEVNKIVEIIGDVKRVY